MKFMKIKLFVHTNILGSANSVKFALPMIVEVLTPDIISHLV